MFEEDKDFKLDISKIPDNVAIKYGYGSSKTFWEAFEFSRKMNAYEERLKEIDKEIKTLTMERNSEVFMAQHELAQAGDLFPRFGRGYEMFVKGRGDGDCDSQYYFYLAKKLEALNESNPKKDDKNAAEIYLDDFILLFFRAGGALDIRYSIDFVRTGEYQSSFNDTWPAVSTYTFMTTYFNRAISKIENKEVCFQFYDPWLLRSWDKKNTIMAQWENAHLGKILVTVTDLSESSNIKASHDRGIPEIFAEDPFSNGAEDPMGGSVSFRSFNPFELAAWLQIKIMHLKENIFLKEDKKMKLDDNQSWWNTASNMGIYIGN